MEGNWLSDNVAMVAGWVLAVAMFVFALALLASVVLGAASGLDGGDDE